MIPVFAGLENLFPEGPGRCNDCRADIPHAFGVCTACGVKRDRAARRQRCTDAFRSIPARYRENGLWAQFGRPELASAVQLPGAVDEAMRGFRRNFLIITGPTSGLGKTALAVALMADGLRRFIDDPRDSDWAPAARFIRAIDLYEAQVTGFEKDGRLLVEEAKTAPFIVLDDLGSEPVSKTQRMFDVVFRRYEEGIRCRTIITTFLDEKATLDRYGAGVDRRLFEDGTFLNLDPNRFQSIPRLRAVEGGGDGSGQV